MVFLLFEVLILKQEDMKDFDGFQKGFIKDEVISVIYYCDGVFLGFFHEYSCVISMY